MDESDFEGTLVLEILNETSGLDEFMEAVDSDDFEKAKSVMKSAGIDSETISMVLKKMHGTDGDH